jgi:hypothetical protein
MADKKGTPLSSIAGFPPDVIQKLAAYWITTAEELAGAAALENGAAGLAKLAGLTDQQLGDLLTKVEAALPASMTAAGAAARGMLNRHGMGALDTQDAALTNAAGGAAPAAAAPLPPNVDLHASFPPVRDQGMRGTCVAHACTAVREYLTGAQSTSQDFSEQFLYWNCKHHDNAPSQEGTYISTGMDRLRADGIPNEADWPYDPNPIPGNEPQDPAPNGILDKAAPRRIISSSKLNANNVDALRQALAVQNPVAFAVSVYSSWFAEPTQTTGDIRLPLPGEQLEGGHALCAVGYQTDASVPGGGYFLVRNSWGTAYARQSPVAPGYIRIPYAYVSQYANSAYAAVVSTSPQPTKPWWQILLDWLRGAH